MFYKDLLHINLKEIPDIIPYQFYDNLLINLAINDIKRLIMAKKLRF